MFNSLSATLLIFIATTGAAFAAGRENAVKIQFEFNGATVVGRWMRAQRLMSSWRSCR
ncbi:hypothetical protein QM136_13780 [Klebsiella michiganensis]|nr:hypothetical protein [Klebsiella michiganensis]